MEVLSWRDGWDGVRERLGAWWNREGLALCITAPRETPLEETAEPPEPADLARRWLDPEYRVRRAEWEMSRTYYGGEAFPSFDPQVGPGNLAAFMGSEPEYAAETVWFNPCIDDPRTHPPLRFDDRSPHFIAQMRIVEQARESSRGRYTVGLPDLIENVDILVSLRGMENVLTDMIDRPGFVEERVREINRAWMEAYERIRARIQDPWGGTTWSCFRIWGKGRTAKVQCDASAGFSPGMFRRFVVPCLAEQCGWLDHSLYHIDGVQALVHLDELCAIGELDAIQWAPGAGRPAGGDPAWHWLYRRIVAAGKSVMVTDVEPRQVVPLLESVGPRGLFLTVKAQSEAQARELERTVARYR